MVETSNFTNKTSPFLLLFLAVLVAVVFSMLPRIPQSPAYHSFADQRNLFGLPNFGDVISNIPFAIIGGWGLWLLFKSTSVSSTITFLDSRERWPYIVLFIGLLLTAFGSSYYHLSPSNARLVWDRLPMTIVFMSMASAIVAEYVSPKVGLWSLPILLLVGAGSVLQWYRSETQLAGDLRFYAAVQTYSALALLLAIVLPKRYTRTSDLAVVVGIYALAKILESLDRPIFAATKFVSGHTLKHLAAAAAGYWILRMLQMRRSTTLSPVVQHELSRRNTKNRVPGSYQVPP
jgi:hypothetical protein